MYNQSTLQKNGNKLVALNSLPKYHRQKYLLALVELSGGMLTKMDLQKLLFLSEQTEKNGHYHFIPYHYGCYSFQAQSDIELMESRGWLKVNENKVQLNNSIVSHINQPVIQQLKYLLGKYEKYRGNELVRYIYEQYPYFAINSKIAKKILSQKAYTLVTQTSNSMASEESILFTIGYEGISIEQYINQLIKNNVKVLCDVRINPLSRKFGFSKASLSNILPKVGVKYVHIPELGIESEKRTHLEEKKDYANLFNAYRLTLANRDPSINKVKALLTEHKRVALTCFEKEYDECHRHCVSDYLIKNDSLIKVFHL